MDYCQDKDVLIKPHALIKDILSNHCFKVWAQLLQTVPDSKLLIKNKQLSDPTLQYRVLARLNEFGIASNRIEMLGGTSKEVHMPTYSRVDIALDSFPYHGTTTTCDTLWMGIPVISRIGNSHVSRIGASLLNRLGLNNLIAKDNQEYVNLAAQLAADKPRLYNIRLGLRDTCIESGLVDGARFTHNFETILLRLWEQTGMALT